MEEPFFAQKPGYPVSPVDPDDVRAVWTIYQETARERPGEQVGLGAEFMKMSCRPGADVAAVWYRFAMLHVLVQHPDERLAHYIQEGQPNQQLFRAAAQVPMEWIGEAEHQGLPFDMDDFLRRLGSPE